VLTLNQLGISEEDWNQTPTSVRAALMFLLQQNQRLENRCYAYELEVQRLKADYDDSTHPRPTRRVTSQR
jgi:hypothetical protein